MNRISAVMLAANMAMLPLAGVVQAQQNPDSTRPRAEWAGRRTRPDMVGRLLAAQTELNLTDAQVAQLTDIQKKYAELNQPILDRLKASRGDSGERGRMRGDKERRDGDHRMTREQRAEMREKWQAERKAWAEAHPEAVQAHKQLMENGQAMRKEVGAVLTEKQLAQVRRMHRHHGDKRGRGRADHTPTG
jgi:hypothetical protein